jgi:hypothetical protein
LHRASRLISAVGSWSEPDHYVGEHFGNVAGRLLSVLCPWRDRLSHVVRPRRGGIWRRSRDVQLLYCARLEPLGFLRLGGRKSNEGCPLLVPRLDLPFSTRNASLRTAVQRNEACTATLPCIRNNPNKATVSWRGPFAIFQTIPATCPERPSAPVTMNLRTSPTLVGHAAVM